MEVEGNEVTVIYWPNGGWLDQSHFCCAEIEEDGTTSFESDEGYQYEVTLGEVGGCMNIYYEEANEEYEEYGEYGDYNQYEEIMVDEDAYEDQADYESY